MGESSSERRTDRRKVPGDHVACIELRLVVLDTKIRGMHEAVLHPQGSGLAFSQPV